MSYKEITSLQHPLVKEFVRLRENREFRRDQKKVLLVGKKTIQDIARTHPIETLISLSKSPIPAQETLLVTEGILKKISGVENPDGFAAIVPFPKEEPIQGKRLLLVLSGLSDPGNVGTLFRTALGLSWDGILLTPGSVDPFNDKALRAAKGASLKLPFWEKTEEEILQLAKELKAHIYTADSKGENLKTFSFHAPLFLVLGSEGMGPSSSFLKMAIKVSIPMISSIESYNVAIAGSILMYQIHSKL